MPGFSSICSLFVSLSVIIRVRVLVSLIWYSSYCHSLFSVIFAPTPKHSCVQPLPQYFSARNLGALKGPGIGYLKKTPQCHGVFLSTKILVWKFENSTCQMERFIPVSQIRSKPQGVCLLFLLQAGYKRAVLGTTILSNGRDFSVGPTEMSGLVKVNHFQRWSQIFRSDGTGMVHSIWFLTKSCGYLGWMESAPEKLGAINLWCMKSDIKVHA